jgi:hypothetical protein
LVVIRSVPCAQSFSLHQFSQLAIHMRCCSVLQKVRPTYYEWHLVAFHPRAVPTHHSTAADTVRPSLLLPGTLGPKECFQVSRTTWLFLGEFGGEHRRQHDGYPAPRTRSCVGLLINYSRKHTSSLNTISSARIPCDLRILMVELVEFYPSQCNSCTDCILYGLHL